MARKASVKGSTVMTRLIAVVATLMAAVPAMAGATSLSPDEIKATFGNGKPFMASSTTGSKTYSFTLKPDGTALRTAKGSTTPTSGTWRVNDKGYCSKWGTSAEACYTIEKNGKTYTVRDAAGKTV